MLDAQRRHDRLQSLGVNRVVVELRPAALAARHEVPAVEVQDQRARPCRPRNVIEVGHDAEHAQAAVLFNQRHGVGVRGEQDLLVLRRAIVLARQIGDDGFAGVALEAGGERQRGRLAGLRVRQHLRAVHAIERERGTVDVLRAESRLRIRRVDATLRQPERRARRQVVHDDDARRVSFDADRGKSVQLTPDPAAMIGARDARRRRCKQRCPFAR